MTLADDKELLVMLSQQRHEERRTRYLWFLTIIFAFTATILFFSYVNQRSRYISVDLPLDAITIRTGSWFDNNTEEDLNDRPIIGILTQELDPILRSKLPSGGQGYSSYLASSYVQWVMAGGARVVPVIIGRDQEYYEKIFAGINGVLLPGGDAPLTGSGGYASVGELFYEWAKEANDKGDFFPVWGTCNGFELLTVLSSKDQSRLTDCDSQDQAVPLIFLPGAGQSNLFSSAPPDVMKEIKEEKITINFHNHCLTPTNFTKFGMEKFWTPLSWNWDRNSLEYLSSIEAISYPFIGVQFHPEKNIYEWSSREPRIPHSKHAVHVSLYFATHFVNMARRNRHRFSSRMDEQRYLSYNFKLHYVGRNDIGWLFEEAYLF